MAWGALLLLASLGAEPRSFITNPSFESVDLDGRPLGWDVFVMPQPGARGTLHDNAADGKFAAMLFTPRPYENEPYNNWSQNIFSDIAGQTVVLEGQIKAEEATEASLWLQCWQKRPARVLYTASTSADTPVYGTRDWTHVRTVVNVPKNTDFVVVRCILRGQGTAWFDDIRLHVQKENEEEEEKEEDPEVEFIEPEETGGVGELNDALVAHDSLLKANTALQETLQALGETNAVLAGQIRIMQEEIESLRRSLTAEGRPAEQEFIEITEPDQGSKAPPKTWYGQPYPILENKPRRAPRRGFFSRFRRNK